MATAGFIPDEPQLRSRRRQGLQEILTEAGLHVEYWLPKLEEHLGVTCARLSILTRKTLPEAEIPCTTSMGEKALEKFGLSQSNNPPELEESPAEMIKKRQQQAEQALQALRDLQAEGKNRQEEAMRTKEAELRQALQIPEECWPLPEVTLGEVTESMQRHLSRMEQTLAHRQNLPDRELVRWASGGLALQGVYKTSHKKDLMERREELLSVPKDFSLSGPEQGKRMEMKEFTTSQEESLFTQTVEKLGFTSSLSAKDEGWGFSLEGGRDQSNQSESMETHQLHSKTTYFCSAKFSYMPTAVCRFRSDHLQLSTAALEELKSIENLLEHTEGTMLRSRTENFFHKFGSHANKGPLHLGEIYCWKATAEGFKSEELADVKKQAGEALDYYIRGSYSGIAVKVGADMKMSDEHSKTTTHNTIFQNLKSSIQVSEAQIGGPPEADGIVQWTNGLVASNKTWSVIDQGVELVPVWDIILHSHRNDFKDPLEVAKCMRDNYTALTGLAAQIQDGEELQSAEKEARLFLEEVKSWEVSDPEEQLTKLIDFKQRLSQKVKSYDIWINTCLELKLWMVVNCHMGSGNRSARVASALNL